jgi:CubicO group peptidase (beta-lactamase class C family)
LIKRIAALPLNYQPGEAWQYSAATDVVGRLVEVLSGQSLDEFFKQRIFAPLDMHDTHFYLNDTLGGRLTAQYEPGEGNKIKLQDPGSNKSRWIAGNAGGNKKVFRGAGGLVSTAHDYIRFQQMVANGGVLDGVRLLSPITVSLMTENHTGTLPLWLPGPGMGFGLGYAVVIDRGAAATPLSLGSAYWGGAFCTLSWFDSKEGVVAAVFTQVRPYNHINIRQDFQNTVYQAIVK